ncbi:MAG TPA: hypothetical protein VK186_26985 [Candidatus Deferrimicrobium sp.]|nr:hypothetical protein [Candidatus Deferrimicrobium sp.]
MKTCAPGLMIFLLFIMVIMSAPGNAYGRVSLKERDALNLSKAGGLKWEFPQITGFSRRNLYAVKQ